MSIRFGTCSWKYPSWHGLVYSAPKGINYLAEYAGKYDTVEVDQWFWSLFGVDKINLPDIRVVREYRDSVPDTFRFTVKAPNSITLTHFYKKSKQETLKANPHFLSLSLFRRFRESVEFLHPLLGAVMFQFEYLNKQKMSSQGQFQSLVREFIRKTDGGVQPLLPRCPLALETRNPSYLNPSYFDFLNRNSIIPVLIQGYYMPSIFDIYKKCKRSISEAGVIIIRLHGPNRSKIEEKTSLKWGRIVEPKDRELDAVVDMAGELAAEDRDIFINVNNHYEGSAPLTIERLMERLERKT